MLVQELNYAYGYIWITYYVFVVCNIASRSSTMVLLDIFPVSFIRLAIFLCSVPSVKFLIVDKCECSTNSWKKFSIRYLVVIIEPCSHKVFPTCFVNVVWLEEKCLLRCKFFNLVPMIPFKPVPLLAKTILYNISAHEFRLLIISVQFKFSLQKNERQLDFSMLKYLMHSAICKEYVCRLTATILIASGITLIRGRLKSTSTVLICSQGNFN